jgi:hypothetical protein
MVYGQTIGIFLQSSQMLTNVRPPQFEITELTLHLFNAISMNLLLILVRKSCLKPWDNRLQTFLFCQCHEIALDMTTSKVPQLQQFFSSDQTTPKRAKNLT